MRATIPCISQACEFTRRLIHKALFRPTSRSGIFHVNSPHTLLPRGLLCWQVSVLVVVAENAKLTSLIAQVTEKAAVAESRVRQSEKQIEDMEARSEARLASTEARFRELSARAFKTTDGLARKTAEVESLTRHLARAREAAVEAGGQPSLPEVQEWDACGEISVHKQKMARLGETLDKERSRWVDSGALW